MERLRCSSDGRGYFAVLTDAGHAKLREARATHLAGVRRLFLQHFDDQELVGWRPVGRALPGAARQ